MQKYFTYLIGWSQLNKWYYGVRYSKDSDPNTLWKTYFTSSKHVKRFRDEFGEPDVVTVRKTFTTPEAAICWEAKVLQRIKASQRADFLNKTNTNKVFYPSQEARNKGGLKNRGRIFSEEHRQKLSATGRGKPKSPEHKNKIREALLGNTRPQEVLDKISKTRKERNYTGSAKRLNKTVLCTVCNKTTNLGNYARWHKH